MAPKIFNLAEANGLLPALESLLARLEAKQESFRKFHDQLFFQELLDAAPSQTDLQALEACLLKLEEEIEEIHRLGCLLRHVERGWVDFLTRRGPEWVYYCWQRGEKEVQFYHPLRGGFFERQPLN